MKKIELINLDKVVIVTKERIHFAEVPPNIQAMREYIVSQGGAISFDEFMSEALYRKNLGLYHSINIGPGLETSFITFSHNQVFVEAVGRQLFQHLGPNNQILELAGGMGVFKAGILSYAKDQGIELNYLSVDISSGLSKRQLEAGGTSVQASALKLPFADNSISGVIFMNELVDALPFKVVKPVFEADKFSHFDELYYVALENGQIGSQWCPCESEGVYAYWARQEAHLQKYNFYDRDEDLSPNRYYCVNLNEEALLRELHRAAAPGTVITIIDYGNSVDDYVYLYTHSAARMYPSELTKEIEQFWIESYKADITTGVNFTNLVSVAGDLGFELLTCATQKKYLNELLSPADKECYRTDPVYASSARALEDGGRRPGDYKVLVVRK